ncbi:hybrid sensor histidine kinase/response regulator [Enterovibrio norvegicus]|uniref:hybrid sensor histidine kinase/response regulator n=1 Tax=Enterovibrio norvegicus TaxID=188144 RepID=UPI00352C9819
MSFRLKTIIGIALIELVLLAILVFSGLNWLRGSNEQQIELDGELLSSTFAIATRDAIISTDLANLNAFTQDAIANKNIVYINVKNDEGRLLAGASSLPDDKHTPNYDQRPSESEDDIYDIRTDVVIDEWKVGEIEFGLNVSSFNALLYNAQKYAVAIAALEIVLVALFSLAFGSLLTKQLLKLQIGAKRISEKGPGDTVPVKGNDEVAQVTRAFNDMSIALAHSYTEISHEKNRYKVLADQNMMLAEIVEQSHEAILVTNKEGKIQRVNHAFSKIFGYKEDGILNKRIMPFLFRQSMDTSPAHRISDAIETASITMVKAQCLNHENVAFWTEITVFPIKNYSGTVERLAFIVRDVTDNHEFETKLKEAVTRAESATKAKSEFLANMSHEIRTPMNGIIGMSDMLQETPLNREQQGFTDIINSSARDLLYLLNDILDFSKLEAQKLSLQEEYFCLRKVVEETMTMISIDATKKEIMLAIDIDPALKTEAYGDGSRLRQILNNLLVNAVKFTEHGYIKLIVTGSEDLAKNRVDYTFCIEDSGIGIPESKINDITTAFQQVDGTTSRRYEGTGLGLAITQRLLTLFNGALHIESKENHGSQFWFTIRLPLLGENRSTKFALDGKNIAIINADPLHRAIFNRYFAHWCANIQYLNNPESVSKGQTRYDVAIVLLSNNVSLPPSLTCPVIGVTPHIEDRTRHTDDAGITLISKPIRMHVLLREVLHALNQKPLPMLEPSSDSYRPKFPDKIKKMSIVVVDDISYNREVIRVYLSELEPNIQFLSNAQQAFEQYKHHPFDILLTDVSMPDRDGYELTQQLRRYEHEHQIPPASIVGLSAHAGRQDFNRAIEAGMDSYLTKPIVREDLTEALIKACRARQALLANNAQS